MKEKKYQCKFDIAHWRKLYDKTYFLASIEGKPEIDHVLVAASRYLDSCGIATTKLASPPLPNIA